MLAQLSYSADPSPRPERVTVAGLPILRAQYDPAAFWTKRRVRRCARQLTRTGCRRVLVPEGFVHWETLRAYGLRPVDPMDFLRAHAAPLALAALRRQGRDPARCAVALRAVRAEGSMERAAWELCPQVRDLCVAAPRGGEQLCRDLRWEFGVAVHPDFEDVPAAVRFDSRTWDTGEQVLDLFPPKAGLGEGEVRLPGLDLEGTEPLSLLCALWEAGKINKTDLEFT